ncbi:MAG: adenylyltransferase/cytidyltransferase family protein [Patescibacteria group bacterium]
MKKIMVFGVFDKLHEGHLNFLRQAKKHGDYLMAVIARDQNVLQAKKRLPRETELTRLKNIQQLKMVNQAILGYKYYKNRSKIVSKFNPQIICLGYDQAILKLKNKNIQIIHLKPYKAKKYKSSLML